MIACVDHVLLTALCFYAQRLFSKCSS